MGRRTQIEALNKLRDSGVLSELDDKLYEWLALNGRASRKLISRRTGIEIATLCGRLDAMKKSGLVAEDGTVICPISKNEVIAYVVTGRTTPINGPSVVEYTLKVVLPEQTWQPPEVEGALSKKVVIRKRQATRMEQQKLAGKATCGRSLLSLFRGKRRFKS